VIVGGIDVIACPDCGRVTPGWDIGGRCLAHARRAAERWTEPVVEREPEPAPKVKPERVRCRRQADGTCDRHHVPMRANGRGKWVCAVAREQIDRRAGRRM
jgi:adenine-specific DNA methylase